MNHRKKLGGRSTSVKTEKEWKNLRKEIETLSPNPSKLPKYIWLSATEGDIGGELGKPNQWPVGVEAGKVFGETSTLESSWRTIQSHGRTKTETN